MSSQCLFYSFSHTHAMTDKGEITHTHIIIFCIQPVSEYHEGDDDKEVIRTIFFFFMLGNRKKTVKNKQRNTDKKIARVLSVDFLVCRCIKSPIWLSSYRQL